MKIFTTILLSLTLFVSLSSSASADSCDRKEWHTRTRALLVRLFPGDEMARHVPLAFACSPYPDAVHAGIGLIINTGLLKFSDAEYSAVLAHEMGHVELRQEPSERFSWFTVVDDLEQLEKNETEADDFSLVALRRAGYSPCVAEIAMLHALKFTSVGKNPYAPHNQIIIRRLARLQMACKNSIIPTK